MIQHVKLVMLSPSSEKQKCFSRGEIFVIVYSRALCTLIWQVSNYLTWHFVTFFSQAGRGGERPAFLTVSTRPITGEFTSFTSLQTPFTPPPFAPHSSHYTPALLSPRGIPVQTQRFMGTAFVEIIKERRACEFSCRRPACFLCHCSLINQRCTEV